MKRDDLPQNTTIGDCRTQPKGGAVQLASHVSLRFLLELDLAGNKNVNTEPYKKGFSLGLGFKLQFLHQNCKALDKKNLIHISLLSKIQINKCLSLKHGNIIDLSRDQ